MVEIGNRRDVDISVDLLRHMVINTIRSHKVKFQRDFGDVVIACDSRKYWRKLYFPYYKANRKKAREESGLDWSSIFDIINLIKEEIKAVFPYPVLEIEGAEADDIVATLAEWAFSNDLKEGTLVPDPNPFLIVSGDHDFMQLQKYSHVKQFSPIHKKFIKPEIPPEKYVIEHIIKGDKGDGIPNVLTSDDAIVKGERQRPVSSKKLNEWLSNPSSMPTDVIFQRNYSRNKQLVDFTYIPESIKQNIINTFVNYHTNDKSKILDYFISNRMKVMIEHLEEF